MGRTVDYALEPEAIKQLLASFLTGAVGLSLLAYISDRHEAAASDEIPGCETLLPRTCASWQSDQGIVTICGVYDQAHSQCVGALVLLLSGACGQSITDLECRRILWLRTPPIINPCRRNICMT